MADFTERTLASKNIFEGKIIDVKLDEVELPNGKKGKRELVFHPGAVAVIALTDDGRILMVRQFRKPLERSIVEIPAGKLERGENPKECAHRELEEETGYRSENMHHVASFYTSPGFSNELIHLYFTDQLTQGQQNTDDDEFVELMAVTLDKALELTDNKEIYDAKTAYAVQYLQLRINLQDGLK